jgi:hypothetical protein
MPWQYDVHELVFSPHLAIGENGVDGLHGVLVLNAHVGGGVKARARDVNKLDCAATPVLHGARENNMHELRPVGADLYLSFVQQ